VQHLSERLAGLVPQIQPLPELGATATVDSTDVFDVGVDARAELGAHGKRRDAAGGANAGEAEDVDEEELDTDGEEHGGGGDGENADGRVVRAGAGDELDHDEEPADGEIPVEPVELPASLATVQCVLQIGLTYVESLRANDPAARVLPPKPPEADKVLDDTDCAEQRCADTEDGVCAQLVSREAIPHAKVEADGHAHAVKEDQKPEPEDALRARPQSVVERRRRRKVGVFEHDLRVRKERGGVRRGRA
jgi:hypothetical protein